MADTSVTLINVLDVEPSKQRELIDLLNEGVEKVIRHRPGYLSVTILASTDGSRVINHARWRSAEDLRAIQADPAVAEFAGRVAAIASVSPKVHEVVSEFHA